RAVNYDLSVLKTGVYSLIFVSRHQVNHEIKRTECDLCDHCHASDFFQTLAEIQFESGYPYIMFEDTVNRANPIAGRINMSNLCS
ncbi:ribonucleotide-diphosphate reductase subunit alpha, partial [Salmonella enterica subsp. enterica serovar Montevideo]|nr:ribonucleotide-diphosphate reductase subunit alpha [Salmonella enterica subsp. enterica serovar Montevideo]